MGTSQSSKGPGSGVPMVPPWADDATQENNKKDSKESSQTQQTPVAPKARFGPARRNLGDFAKSGEKNNLKRALGQYTRGGYGGAARAAQRLSSTAATAAVLAGVLNQLSGSSSSSTKGPIDSEIIKNGSAEQILDAVVNATKEIDGSQDSEASRAAIRDALTDVLTEFPETDLTELSLEQCDFVIERYTAHEIIRRFELDLGKTILEKAPTASVALSRLKEAKDYVIEVVAEAFRKSKESNRQTSSSSSIKEIIKSTLREAFTVFEGYAL